MGVNLSHLAGLIPENSNGFSTLTAKLLVSSAVADAPRNGWGRHQPPPSDLFLSSVAPPRPNLQVFLFKPLRGFSAFGVFTANSFIFFWHHQKLWYNKPKLTKRWKRPSRFFRWQEKVSGRWKLTALKISNYPLEQVRKNRTREFP